MRFTSLVLLAALTACAAEPAAPDPQEAAVRAVTLSTPALSWDALRIHPALRQRACAVSTLVNEDGQTVGYCERGRQCRTNDWRPVEDGCGGAPGRTPAAGGLTVAGRG